LASISFWCSGFKVNFRVVKAGLFFFIGLLLWDHPRVAEARGFSRFCGGVGFRSVEMAKVGCWHSCFWGLGYESKVLGWERGEIVRMF